MKRSRDDGFAADLVAGMRCGLITLDRHGCVRALNESAREILKVDQETAVGQPAQRAFSAYPQLARLLAQAASMSTLPDRAELEIQTPAGEDRTLGFTMSRVVAEDGEVRGVALFFKDLTPIERQEQREQLQERLASLGAMAASLAHEIRNPLAALEVTTTLLRRKLPESGTCRDLADTLQDQVRRLSGTVNDSLEYVRPLQIHGTPCNLAELLDEALEVCTPDRIAPKVEVVRWYPQETRLLQVDAGRMRSALVNLIRNALESMGENAGVLRLSLDIPQDEAPEVGHAIIRVSDTGPGIPEDIQPRIFNPFYSTKPNGSGLGLAWTRKVVDAHDGFLDVHSTPKEGAVFTIRLPLSAATAVPELNPAGETLHETQDSSRRG
ncbi:MAG: ATP-binding protein [Acidobacteria bacterium]|nr:ATP-binding protein [Acidobacteriota bacterium]